jgi:hypothetical protein
MKSNFEKSLKSQLFHYHSILGHYAWPKVYHHLLTRVVQVYHPFHVDVGMATIQQTFKCLELIIGK